MSNRKPHNNLAGYIFERKHPLGHIVCFNASEAGIDTENKYVITLEIPGNSRIGPCFTSIPQARDFIKAELEGNSGYDWAFKLTYKEKSKMENTKVKGYLSFDLSEPEKKLAEKIREDWYKCHEPNFKEDK